MNGRIYHQYRSTYVFTDQGGNPGVSECTKALAAIGIVQWSRIDFEPLHFAEGFDGPNTLTYGHDGKSENLYGFRFVNVVRPEGMQNLGWHS